MGYITLYHYTSKSSAEKIKQQEVIKASDPDGPDAKFGEGVYLTSFGPEMGKDFLNKNNWGGRRKINRKLEAYVKIKMNEDDRCLNDVSEGGRVIFLYEGDLDLEEYSYEIKLFNWKFTLGIISDYIVDMVFLWFTWYKSKFKCDFVI